jgi:8-oxo-dGTP pyrophosphatase MutT (NUDIX family)
MMTQNDLHLKIKEVLSQRKPRSIQITDTHYRHAGVLVPLFRDSGEYKVLFTKRTNRVEHHKGQVSFPGGRVDDGDSSIEETALRETHEEIGLPRDEVTILGRTDDMVTLTSSFIVHPFVGLIPYPYDFRISTSEVKRLVQVPFEIFFSDTASYYKKDVIEIGGNTYPGPVYEYQEDVIWGATARIMENFIDIIEEKLRLPQEEQ